jgi:hypothetical protein
VNFLKEVGVTIAADGIKIDCKQSMSVVSAL